MPRQLRALTIVILVGSALAGAVGLRASRHAAAPARQTVTIRGHAQSLRLYGPHGGNPVIVSSGDGGWIRLGPHVAKALAAKGFFVVGFDVKAYLESFTTGASSLRVDDEPGDYQVLVNFAARETGRKPVLIGVSEGAGLSVLAASDPGIKQTIAGVIGLGLSDLTELGWRWQDMLIYLTHTAPHEPAFSTKAIAGRLAPVPLAAIHSTRDEYVPLAEVQDVLADAREPKRLWIIDAWNHRFSGNVAHFDQCLFEAIAWVYEQSRAR